MALLLAVPPAGAQTTVDYDTDDDGLIEIDSAAKLIALRYDLDGSGAADSSGDNTSYAAGFPTPLSTQCPSSACTGYELTGNITLTAAWTPTGSYTATFEGNGNTISGLSVTVSSGNAGLFGNISTATGVIRNVGLINPAVSSSSSGGASAGALVGNAGAGSRIDASYVSGGSVTASENSLDVGGLVGHSRGSIRASYSTAQVIVSGTRANKMLRARAASLTDRGGK